MQRKLNHGRFLKTVLTHQRDFATFHKQKMQQLSRVSKGAKHHHDEIATRATREEDRNERMRLKALRSNDMDAYMKLVEETKNKRLQFLLNQTDEYLNSIKELIKKQTDEGKAAPRGEKKNTDGSEVMANPDQGQESSINDDGDEEITRQPLMLVGGDLKEYQLKGLSWMVSLYNKNLNGILADEMGLGKTIQTIALLTYVMESKHNNGPFLVVVPLSTLSNWVNEFTKWAPECIMVTYKGPPQTRKDIFKQEMSSGQYNVLLTTYEYVMKDKHVLKKIDWQYTIVDEGHRMKNAQSKFAQTLGTQYSSKHRLLLTGTPLQNNLPELWALLNFLLPKIFSSVDNFEMWFSKPFDKFKGGKGEQNEEESPLGEEERILIINRLHSVLRPFMLRRIKDNVLGQLPEKVEKVIRCELSGWQKLVYKQLQEHGVAQGAQDTGQKKSSSRGLSNILMQLRKICNHPYLFIEDAYNQANSELVRSSGKFELLDRMLPKLKRAGHRVLMFSQMTNLMTILEDYFIYRRFSYLRLDGSTSADDREQRMYQFNAPDSPYFIFLLSTRAGGLGLNLATADTVILFDSDWNPMMDKQAQDRAHRIGQKNEVRARLHSGTTHSSLPLFRLLTVSLVVHFPPPHCLVASPPSIPLPPFLPPPPPLPQVRVLRLVTNSPIEDKILQTATDKLGLNSLVVDAGKFNNKKKKADEGNAQAERKAMIQELLKASWVVFV
jgi:SNF2 family DNA or RNA helicase